MDPLGTSRQPSSIDLPPFRSGDFMGKFMVPAYNEKKFLGRVRDNLLYYQTNYFAIWIATCIIGGFLRPQRMISSLISFSMLGVIAVLLQMKHPELVLLRRRYPYVITGLVFGAAFILWYNFDYYLLLCGFLIPFLIILGHASFRARNISNKLSKRLNQTMETLGFTTTPMGHLLSTFGIEIK